MPEQFLPLVLIVSFSIMWIGISYVLSHMGGWAALAEEFPDLGQADVPEAQTFRWRSGGVGPVSYNNCLTLRICDAGLRLSVMLPFRMNHPPIFIPWGEMHGASISRFLWHRRFKAYIGLPVVAYLHLPAWVSDYYPHPIDGQ